MSMDVTNTTQNTKVDDDMKAFQADLAREEFMHRVETGALTPEEQADWDEMMS